MENLTIIDMHTGGEPLRIVTGGYPPIPRGTILDKRAYVRDKLDHLRKILIFEPRGHYDMYAALLVERICLAPTSPCCSCTMRAIPPCVATPSSRSAATLSTKALSLPASPLPRSISNALAAWSSRLSR
jgi:proline racemase